MFKIMRSFKFIQKIIFGQKYLLFSGGLQISRPLWPWREDRPWLCPSQGNSEIWSIHLQRTNRTQWHCLQPKWEKMGIGFPFWNQQQDWPHSWIHQLDEVFSGGTAAVVHVRTMQSVPRWRDTCNSETDKGNQTFLLRYRRCTTTMAI